MTIHVELEAQTHELDELLWRIAHISNFLGFDRMLLAEVTGEEGVVRMSFEDAAEDDEDETGQRLPEDAVHKETEAPEIPRAAMGGLSLLRSL